MKKFCFLLILIVIVLATLSSCQYVSDAKKTAFQEFKPSTLLKKYEWFKDASAQLDKKIADIKVYQIRIDEMNKSYIGVSRKDWAREDREQLSIWMSEVAGVKASYNALSSEYNAQMAKFNWKFCNVGDLPEGTTQVLPREYKPYIDQ